MLQVKMLSLVAPSLLCLKLLIALITRSAVNICAISKDFFLVFLVGNPVSPEEVCIASFELLFESWLNLVAIRLNVFVYRCGSGYHNSILTVHVRWGFFYGGHLV